MSLQSIVEADIEFKYIRGERNNSIQSNFDVHLQMYHVFELIFPSKQRQWNVDSR